MININYNPDVLSCIANLSSDEVFTPPKVANEVLDLLPSDIWKDPSIRFLDPVSKSGVFLREITKRLLVGLETEIPDLQTRLDHILSKQVFGIALTELTALLSRRSLYCSKDAHSQQSVASVFSDGNGNIFFDNGDHTWRDEKCVFCGATKNTYSRDEGLEKHAYKFIHSEDVEDIFGMKFDVIVGNPPYHLSDAGESTGSSPIYQKFVETAKNIEPSYMAMIIPSRWFAGGKNLNEFRNSMLSDARISRIVDYPIAGEIFPGLKVIGGICYFLWEKNYKGNCTITTRMGEDESTLQRPLDEFDVFVRFNRAIPILKKVLSKNLPSLAEQVSSQKPFGLRTFERPSGNGEITLYANGGSGKIEISRITRNVELIDNWKVLLSMGYGEGGEVREYPRRIIGKPIVAEPPSACTETYIVVAAFEKEVEAKRMANYLRTVFARFLIALRKNTQHITSDRFRFVPELPMDKDWNDSTLTQYFNLSDDEFEFMTKLVKPLDD